MTQPSLLDWRPVPVLGSTFDPVRDEKRLSKQQRRVFDVMRDGKKRTLDQLAADSGAPPASASARFRDLRRAGYPVFSMPLGGGTWLYWMEVGQ